MTALFETVALEAGEDLFTTLAREAPDGGLGGASHALDKLTLLLNPDLQDPFQLSNNFQVGRDPKTGQDRLSGGVGGRYTPPPVTIGGQPLRLPALEASLELKDGKPVLRIPTLGYDYTLGDPFDYAKALKGAGVVGRGLLATGTTLVQNMLLPKSMDKWLSTFVAGLGPAERAVVGPFASLLTKHGRNAIKVAVDALTLGDASAARKLVDKAVSSLQQDLGAAAKRAGDGALKELGRSLGIKIDTRKTDAAVKTVRAVLGGKTDIWDAAKQVAQDLFGVPVAQIDAALTALNETIQDPFNLSNNLPAGAGEIALLVDESVNEAGTAALGSGPSEDGDDSAFKLSFTLDD